MIADAIILRGGVSPPQLGIQLVKWRPWSHAAIRLIDGSFVEASALKNEVLHHQSPLKWHSYQRVLSLGHLGEEAQRDIGLTALGMKGLKYDWNSGRMQAVEAMIHAAQTAEQIVKILKLSEDDIRRVICYEHVGLSTRKHFKYTQPMFLVDDRDILRAWRQSLKEVVR
jgi:hypothetical protein